MSLKNKKVKFEELGLKNYMDAFEYQQSLMDEIIQIKIKNRDLPEEKDHGTLVTNTICLPMKIN